MTKIFDQNIFMYFPYSQYFNFFTDDSFLEPEDFDFSFETFKILMNLKAYCSFVNKRNFENEVDLLHTLKLPCTKINLEAAYCVFVFYNREMVELKKSSELEYGFSFELLNEENNVRMKLSLFNMIEDDLSARLYAHLLYCEQRKKLPKMNLNQLIDTFKIKGQYGKLMLKRKLATSLRKIAVIDSQFNHTLDFILSI